jgi:hypothetical protein
MGMLTFDKVVLKGSATENDAHLSSNTVQRLRRVRLVVLDLVSAIASLSVAQPHAKQNAPFVKNANSPAPVLEPCRLGRVGFVRCDYEIRLPARNVVLETAALRHRPMETESFLFEGQEQPSD